MGSNLTPEHNLVRAHGTLDAGCLYPVYYVWATERPWTSLNEYGMYQTPNLLINYHHTAITNTGRCYGMLPWAAL